MKQDIRVVPSLLSADFGRFSEQVALLENQGCDLFHVDVMDGHFVPNLTYGPKMVRDLAKKSKAGFDCHLMVREPEKMIPWFDHPSVRIITIHPEATVHLHRALHQIREMGKKAGVSLNPATPLSVIENVLPDLDLLMIMTVNPGFGGQSYIPQMTGKIADAAEICSGHNIIIEVDGGIDEKTLPETVKAGARYLVAGNAVYGREDPVKAWEQLEKMARNVTG